MQGLNFKNLDETGLSWFKTYLTDRHQCVQIESVVSYPQKITHGVPQGSILGPIIFLLYIMDMPLAVDFGNNEDNLNNNSADDGQRNQSHVVIYADDNTPTTSHQNIDQLYEKNN